LPEVTKSQGMLMQRFKLKLLSRGIKGIIGLEKQFSLYDLDKTGLLDYKDFAQAVNDFNLGYDERDIPGLFRIFEKLSNGRLRIALFMEALLGKMNESRREVVTRVFDMLDDKKAGEIDLEFLLGSFCPKAHPEVKAGKITAEEVDETFKTSFNTFHELYYGGNKVTKPELIDYFNKFSSLLEDDSYFDIVVSEIWGLLMSLRKHKTAGTAFNVFQENSRRSWNNDFHKTLFRDDHPMRPESEFGDDIKRFIIFQWPRKGSS
jgi:Ca2+-binding EF-hand superfamily protein